jgi:hypothetical protein
VVGYRIGTSIWPNNLQGRTEPKMGVRHSFLAR